MTNKKRVEVMAWIFVITYSVLFITLTPLLIFSTK